MSSTPELFAAAVEPLAAKSVRTESVAAGSCHLVVGADLSSGSAVTSLAESLKAGGFVLLQESTDVSEAAFSTSGLQLVSRVLAERRAYFLLRKVTIRPELNLTTLILKKVSVLEKAQGLIRN